jgi:hypothetical protein
MQKSLKIGYENLVHVYLEGRSSNSGCSVRAGRECPMCCVKHSPAWGGGGLKSSDMNGQTVTLTNPLFCNGGVTEYLQKTSYYKI